ncbi:MAG TPA: hypothetical protein VGK42_13770 [Candidatus Dormibacteraeota bacterium]
MNLKEDAMYLSVGIVFALILVLASPFIWVAWWLLADVGEAASGSRGATHQEIQGQPTRRAA